MLTRITHPGSRHAPFFLNHLTAMALVGGVMISMPASAQTAEDDKNRARDRQQQTEQEKETLAEEAWYDVAEWFDGDDIDTDPWVYRYRYDQYQSPTVDEIEAREGNDDLAEAAARRAAQQEGDQRQFQGRSYREHYDAYFDGYYDGYRDDSFGYDHLAVDRRDTYSDFYRRGYYDGFYDHSQDYDADPFFYVINTEVDPQSMEQRSSDVERFAADRSRTRMRDRDGRDRDAATDGEDQSEAQRDHLLAREYRESQRIRGTIEAMEPHDAANLRGHAIRRIDMENRTGLLIDFGPKVTEENMPIGEGDRVTLVGHWSQMGEGDDRVFIVDRIIADGQRIHLREADFPQQDDEARQRTESAEYDDTDRYWYREWNDDADDASSPRDRERPAQRERDRDRERAADDDRAADEGADHYNRPLPQGDRETVATDQPHVKPGMMSLRGVVQRFRDAPTDDNRNFKMITFKDGRTRLIDFDYLVDSGEVEIEEGDRIRIYGHSTDYEGRQIILPSRLIVNDEVIDRTDDE